MGDRYWVGGTGTWNTAVGSKWSLTSGGAGGASVPTASDNVYIDANSGGGLITGSSSMTCRSLNMTNSGPSMSMSGATHVLNIGDGTAGAGNVAFIGNNGKFAAIAGSNINFISTSATQQTVDFNDATGTALGNVTFDGVGGSWILAGGHQLPNSTSATWTVNNGSVDFNGKTIKTGLFISNTTTARTIIWGNADLTLNGTGVILNMVITNLTFSGANCTVRITDASGSSKTIGGGSGLAWGDNIVTPGGAGVVSYSSSHTWLSQHLSAPGTKTIQYNASQTRTIRGHRDAFWQGTAGNLVTIQTSSAGSPATITTPKANVQLASDYISLKDITGTGLTPHYAGRNSTDVSGNTGWRFDTLETSFLPF